MTEKTYRIRVEFEYDKILYIKQETKSSYNNINDSEYEQLKQKVIQIIIKQLTEQYFDGALTVENLGAIEIQ